MTLEETADFISQDLPKYQRDLNLEFLEQVHQTLKDDGVWAYPMAGMVFKKTEGGFELLLDS